jgi:integrase
MSDEGAATVLPLPKPRKQRKLYRPWKHNGATLGHIRGEVYWIDRTLGGVRYRLTTNCKTADAAFEEYKRFEVDPVHYAPRGTIREGAAWAEAVLAFAQYKRDIEGRSEKYVDELVAQLERFGLYRGFSSLDSFAQRDIEAFLADLVQGNLTGRLVNELDEHGKPVVERDAAGNVLLDKKSGKPRHRKKLVREERPREASRNRHLAALKSLMSWARERTPPLSRNTADTTVAIGQEDRNVRPPEPIEKERWEAAAKHLPARWLAAQQVLLGSGLRWSELARLTAEDLKPRGIIVRKAKRRKGRTVPVSARTVEAAHKVLKLGGVPDDTASQMDHRLEAACRAAGVKRYTAHHLRHTFGTTCLRNGVDVRTLQEWMGHADLATTMKYLHAVRAEDGLPDVPAPF